MINCQCITGRYMQLAFRTARTFWLMRTVKRSAVRPAPAPAGDSLLVSRFLPTREQTNNIIILHRTTSAKTRATATLRQLHIPPNVRYNSSHMIFKGLGALITKLGGQQLLSLRRDSPTRRHLAC